MEHGSKPTVSMTRQEADKSYRTMRAYLVFSACWFLVVAVALAVLDVSGWQFYLIAVVAFEPISIPAFLWYYRRELDKRVKASDAALGRVNA